MLLIGPAHRLSPHHVWQVAHLELPVALDPDAHPLLCAGERALDALIARGAPLYGINTGFGPLVTAHIAPQGRPQRQRNRGGHRARG